MDCAGKRRLLWGVAALVAVGAVSWGVLWALKVPEKKEKATSSASVEKRGLIADVAPATSAVERVKTVREVTNAVTRAKEETEGEEWERPTESGYYTNREGKVCYFHADKCVFSNGVEQLLHMAIPSEPGAAVPPLPIVSGDDAKAIRAALKSKLVANENDDEAMLERKITINEGKIELAELYDERGMTVSEYVNALRDKFNDDNDFLAAAKKMDDEIYADEKITDEDYAKARAQINEKLKERGLPALEDRE